MDVWKKTAPENDEGQSAFVHLWMLLVEVRVVPTVVAFRVLTLFRRERLLDET